MLRFWKRRGDHKVKIKAVAIGQSKADREAVSTHLAKATIDFDRENPLFELEMLHRLAGIPQLN